MRRALFIVSVITCAQAANSQEDLILNFSKELLKCYDVDGN